MYCGKIYFKLTILIIFTCSVALSALSLLYNHPHRPPPELFLLPKLKLCPHETSISHSPPHSEGFFEYIIYICPDIKKEKEVNRTSLAIQWLRHCAPNAGSMGLIAGLMLGKIKGRRKRGQQRMRWLEGTID